MRCACLVTDGEFTDSTYIGEALVVSEWSADRRQDCRAIQPAASAERSFYERRIGQGFVIRPEKALAGL